MITSVASLNVRGLQFGGDKFKVRMVSFYDYVRAHSVDEVHLQEVFTYGMLRELARNMPSLAHAVYEKGIAGPKGGLVSFYKERPERVAFYPLVPSLLARFDPFWVIPYIHKGVLVTHLPGGRLRCNLHLDPNHSGDWENANSQVALTSRQLQEIARVIDGLIQKSNPVNILVLGDFNLPHTTPAYTDFVRDVGLQDAFEADRRPTYHAAFLPSGRRPHQVDHILVWSKHQPSKALKRFQYILTNPVRRNGHDIYASDHVGLAVEISN